MSPTTSAKKIACPNEALIARLSRQLWVRVRLASRGSCRRRPPGGGGWWVHLVSWGCVNKQKWADWQQCGSRRTPTTAATRKRQHATRSPPPPAPPFSAPTHLHAQWRHFGDARAGQPAALQPGGDQGAASAVQAGARRAVHAVAPPLHAGPAAQRGQQLLLRLNLLAALPLLQPARPARPAARRVLRRRRRRGAAPNKPCPAKAGTTQPWNTRAPNTTPGAAHLRQLPLMQAAEHPAPTTPTATRHPPPAAP
jgi:hypothetical protein